MCGSLPSSSLTARRMSSSLATADFATPELCGGLVSCAALVIGAGAVVRPWHALKANATHTVSARPPSSDQRRAMSDRGASAVPGGLTESRWFGAGRDRASGPFFRQSAPFTGSQKAHPGQHAVGRTPPNRAAAAAQFPAGPPSRIDSAEGARLDVEFLAARSSQGRKEARPCRNSWF